MPAVLVPILFSAVILYIAIAIIVDGVAQKCRQRKEVSFWDYNRFSFVVAVWPLFPVFYLLHWGAPKLHKIGRNLIK